MSKITYSLNKEIEAFVLQKDKAGTPYTKEDIAFVNRYTGFGGLWDFEDDLKKERGLYEYYTPIEIVEKMIGLASKFGYKSGPVLEPSCGTGRFLHYFSPSAKVTALEPDQVSFLIAKANFPAFNIEQKTFNSLFVDRRGNSIPFKPAYKLIIGNPPYGAFEGRHTATEKQLTRANTYVDYFITRGLDLLFPGGLLIYVIPSAFMDGHQTKAKEQILEKSELLDAYRLPKSIFTQTDIQTDIVVLKKI